MDSGIWDTALVTFHVLKSSLDLHPTIPVHPHTRTILLETTCQHPIDQQNQTNRSTHQQSYNTVSSLALFQYWKLVVIQHFLPHPQYCSVKYVLYGLDPDLLPKVQVDRGAIRFVMKGSNIMCPGLTSPGAKLDVEIAKSTPCVCGACELVFWDWQCELCHLFPHSHLTGYYCYSVSLCHFVSQLFVFFANFRSVLISDFFMI